MRRLIIDVGGTNLRICYQANLAEGITHIHYFRCSDFPEITICLKEYCDAYELQIDLLVIAAAAPISGPKVSITNNGWSFDARDVAKLINAKAYLLINDFAAQALACQELLDPKYKVRRDRHLCLRSGQSDCSKPLLICGPGTGLGVSALVPSEAGPMLVEGEGGHVTYTPRNKVEEKVLVALATQFPHVSADRVISGPGLERIHHILNGENKFAHEILAAALADQAASQQTVFLMLESFATVLANAALSFGSGAGIVVAGGIVPRMTKLLPQSDFFNRFDNHGRLSDFLRVLPIYLSVDPCAGLRGGAIAPENQNLTKKIVRI